MGIGVLEQKWPVLVNQLSLKWRLVKWTSTVYPNKCCPSKIVTSEGCHCVKQLGNPSFRISESS